MIALARSRRSRSPSVEERIFFKSRKGVKRDETAVKRWKSFLVERVEKSWRVVFEKPDFSQELDEAALEAQRQQKVQHLVQHAVVESIQFIFTKAFWILKAFEEKLIEDEAWWVCTVLTSWRGLGCKPLKSLSDVTVASLEMALHITESKPHVVWGQSTIWCWSAEELWATYGNQRVQRDGCELRIDMRRLWPTSKD